MPPLLVALTLLTVPGPDTTIVLANASSPESLALARRYADARGLPPSHLCTVELPIVEDVGLDAYAARIAPALRDCLDVDGLGARAEAIVLARDLPLRVSIPRAGGGAVRVSLAAALALGDTTTSTGAPLLGLEPGQPGNCGPASCYAARWVNPFRSGTFGPGWTSTANGVTWRPRLVTMLHGRSAAAAARLIASATTAEALGGAMGRFTFMRGADPARGVLDASYPGVVRALAQRGFADAEIVDFDGAREGQRYAAFFVGAAALGRAIEGNGFAPGALVDNLTSFGAVAENFRASGEEVQVSIARWVDLGVAGVHGTTDEPLNNVFPDRALIVPYVEGGTLGEAYFRAMPYAYWQNLVLGDVMAAPYATRPAVAVDGPDGPIPADAPLPVAGSVSLRVAADDPLGRRLEALQLFVDGRLVAESRGEPIDACVDAPAGRRVHVLAVAQVADRRTTETRHRPKGWRAGWLQGGDGPAGCAASADAGVEDAAADDVGAALDGGPAAPDGGDAEPRDGVGTAPDAGQADAAAPAEPTGGCGCQAAGPGVGTAGSGVGTVGGWALAGLLCATRRRARRRS
jgi:hypothetical protein